MAQGRSSYVLLTLGLMFTAGAAARFLPANLTAEASTAAPAHPAETDDHAEAAPESGEHEAPPAKPIDQACFSPETAALLAEDQKAIEAQQTALREKELTLQEREQTIERRFAELEAIRNTLDQRWGEMQEVSDEDIMHLARMYGSMKPDQAASIFNQMSPDFAAGFLRLMRSEQAGLIMAAMETHKAYQVSVVLAEKNEDIRESANTLPEPQ